MPQCQGACVYAMTAAMHSAITLENGAVQESNFHDDEMVRADNFPELVKFEIGIAVNAGLRPANQQLNALLPSFRCATCDISHRFAPPLGGNIPLTLKRNGR